MSRIQKSYADEVIQKEIDRQEKEASKDTTEENIKEEHRRKILENDPTNLDLERIVKRIEKLNERISAEFRQAFFSQYFLADRGINGSANPTQKEGIPTELKKLDKYFHIASSKEIEWELIKILEEIERFRVEYDENFAIPEFIFIFDELDKIEPHAKYSLSDKESENPYYDIPADGGGTDKIRTRREAVAALLANLKNFLNTARAKFIFIGGREMYDASLADIADRDSFYSSIFHDVIYVESFLKDGLASQQGEGLTLMTEMYMCKLLLPDSYLRKRNLLKENVEDQIPQRQIFNLRTYYQYLKDTYLETDADNQHHDLESHKVIRKFNKEELAKIIYALQNFVVYLTYRSNGTPKKLTSLFEDQLVPRREKFCNDPYHMVVGRAPEEGEQLEDLFLRFKPTDQYIIGLTTVIYRPYIITHSRYQKIWGDKLLFSTSYIIDHILKFHAFGFSWRNLELIPELITINKAPQLRLFIKDLLEHYSNLFVRTTVGGIFRYRFYNKASNEIKYVSKVSELAVAAFNFTLDESLMIKRHYHKRLKELKASYEDYKGYDKRSRYAHSIGFVHAILGDLHYYDQEYDDAIIHYSDAIQHLRGPKIIDLSEHQVILLITNKLKLGLTLEKIQSFETAFTVYRELIEDVPKYFVEKSNQKSTDKKKGINGNNEGNTNEPFDHYRGFRLMSQAYLAMLHVLEKLRSDGIGDFDLEEHEKAFMRFISFDKEPTEKYWWKSTEKSQFLFSPRPDLSHTLISNYYNNVGSILFYKNKNFVTLISNLRYFDPFFPIRAGKKSSEEELLNAYYDYLSELQGVNVPDYNPSFSAYINYRESLRWLLLRFEKELKPVRHFILKNQSQRIIYQELIRAQNVLINPYLFDLLIILSDQIPRTINSSRLYDLGNLMGKIGDSILTFISPKLNHPPSEDVIKWLFKEPHKGDPKYQSPIRNLVKCYDYLLKQGKKKNQFYSIELVLFTYRLAAEFYLKAGQVYSYAFQYKKTLYIIRDYLAQLNSRKKNHQSFPNYDTPKLDGFISLKSCLPFIKDKIALPIIKAITWENKTANRPQILKYKDIFGFERDMSLRNRQSLFTNVSSGSELWEVILLVSDIQLKLCSLGKIKFEELDLKLDYLMYSPLMVVSSKFVKIIELKFKADLNQLFFKHWGFDRLIKNLPQEEEEKDSDKSNKKETIPFEDKLKNISGKKSLKIASLPQIKNESKKRFDLAISSYSDILEYLISDSISNLAELIHTLNVYGKNYMASYSYLGFIHLKLATWCRYYRTLLREQDDNDEEKSIFKKLKALLGRDYLYFLEIRYHYELAIQYFHSALQLHREGKTYKDALSDMFYLEDDFNDNLYHFCAALERYKINTGSIRSIINELKRRVEGIQDDPINEYEGSKFYRYDTYIDKSESSEEGEDPSSDED